MKKFKKIHKKYYVRKSSKNKKNVKPTKKFIKIVEIPEIPISEVIPKKRRKPKTKKSSANKMYFTQDTEDSIVSYNSTDNTEIRNDLYNIKIKYAFEKLVENIFNTFKFSYFETGPLDVQKETVSHLVANIGKFESGKGKAFSYFSIIAKNYLIALNNSTYKRFNQHVEIGEERDDHTVQLQSEDKHYKEAELNDFMRLMIVFWENNVGKVFTKQRDLDIANAIIELFRQTQNITMFNKKALYLYIRDISNCKTQMITKIINRMKIFQSKLYKSYVNYGTVPTNLYDISK